jgi:hypothetical protein
LVGTDRLSGGALNAALGGDAKVVVGPATAVPVALKAETVMVYPHTPFTHGPAVLAAQSADTWQAPPGGSAIVSLVAPAGGVIVVLPYVIVYWMVALLLAGSAAGLQADRHVVAAGWGNGHPRLRGPLGNTRREVGTIDLRACENVAASIRATGEKHARLQEQSDMEVAPRSQRRDRDPSSLHGIVELHAAQCGIAATQEDFARRRTVAEKDCRSGCVRAARGRRGQPPLAGPVDRRRGIEVRPLGELAAGQQHVAAR